MGAPSLWVGEYDDETGQTRLVVNVEVCFVEGTPETVVKCQHRAWPFEDFETTAEMRLTDLELTALKGML